MREAVGVRDHRDPSARCRGIARQSARLRDMASPYEDQSGDPGWGGPRVVFTMILPFLAIGTAAHRGTSDALIMMRMVFVYFVQTLVILAVVVIALSVSDTIPGSDVDPMVAALAVAAVGGMGLVLARVVPPALDCTTSATLVGTYRTRFFIRLALAEAGAMAGFVGFIVTGRPILFLLGTAFTAAGFARAAPTIRQLERDQEELSWSGCGRLLIPTLRGLSD